MLDLHPPSPFSSAHDLVQKSETLMPRVKTSAPDTSSKADPYIAFRRRVERMQTRKVRAGGTERGAGRGRGGGAGVDVGSGVCAFIFLF